MPFIEVFLARSFNQRLYACEWRLHISPREWQVRATSACDLTGNSRSRRAMARRDKTLLVHGKLISPRFHVSHVSVHVAILVPSLWFERWAHRSRQVTSWRPYIRDVRRTYRPRYDLLKLRAWHHRDVIEFDICQRVKFARKLSVTLVEIRQRAKPSLVWTKNTYADAWYENEFSEACPEYVQMND